MNNDDQSKKIGQILAKCWSDESFKKKLMADPMGTLKTEGAKMPEGLSVNVLENTDKVFNLVIPAKPTDLTDADLEKVAGGGACFADYTPGAFEGKGKGKGDKALPIPGSFGGPRPF